MNDAISMTGTLSGAAAARLDAARHAESPRVARGLDRLRETTGQVVGRVFFGTMLRQMRESSLKGAYGHGGRGEEVFSAQLHDLLAERMGTSPNNELTEAIYERYAKQQRLIGEADERNTAKEHDAHGGR